MKKKLNSSSKRKWVLNGVLAFGAVALLTTGFATWVVGVNQPTQGTDAVVGVDTVTNDSFLFEIVQSTVKEDKDILLGEARAFKDSELKPNNGLVRVIDNDNPEHEDPLCITWGKGTRISYGNTAGTPKEITFSFTSAPSEPLPTSIHSNPVADDKISTWLAEPANEGLVTDNLKTFRTGTINYINLPATIDLSNIGSNNEWQEVPKGSSALTTYELKADKKIEFTWGNYFNNQSPATFYNSLTLKEGITAKQKVALADIITQEMDEMFKVFNDNTLKVTATLNMVK